MLQQDVPKVVSRVTSVETHSQALCRQFDNIRGIDPFGIARLEFHEDHGDAVVVNPVYSGCQHDGLIDRKRLLGKNKSATSQVVGLAALSCEPAANALQS